MIGDRVALVLTNGVPFVVTYLAVLGLGGVIVPLNPTSPAPELEAPDRRGRRKVVVVIDRSCAATWAHVDRRGRSHCHRRRHHRSGDAAATAT